jgi:hypothetical protein
MKMVRFLLVAVLLTGRAGVGRAEERETGPVRPGAVLRGLDRVARTEFGEMFLSILARGADMGPGRGWFHPSQSRYDWKWLAARYDRNGDGRITRDELGAADELFDRLDRDRDGAIRAADLDGGAAWRARMGPAQGLFQQLDRDTNGKLTRAEWDQAFDRLAKGKDFLTAEDLMDLLSPPRPAASKPTGPPAMPSRWLLLRGLLSGEIGSPFEGPALNSLAPGFTLPTPDGAFDVTLDPARAGRPVVLVFGSFS